MSSSGNESSEFNDVPPYLKRIKLSATAQTTRKPTGVKSDKQQKSEKKIVEEKQAKLGKRKHAAEESEAGSTTPKEGKKEKKKLTPERGTSENPRTTQKVAKKKAEVEEKGDTEEVAEEDVDDEQVYEKNEEEEELSDVEEGDEVTRDTETIEPKHYQLADTRVFITCVKEGDIRKKIEIREYYPDKGKNDEYLPSKVGMRLGRSQFESMAEQAKDILKTFDSM